jgi:hypothetical protein
MSLHSGEVPNTHFIIFGLNRPWLEPRSTAITLTITPRKRLGEGIVHLCNTSVKVVYAQTKLRNRQKNLI